MVSGARPFSPLDASENGSEKLHDDQFDSHLEQVPILQFLNLMASRSVICQGVFTYKSIPPPYAPTLETGFKTCPENLRLTTATNTFLHHDSPRCAVIMVCA